MAIKELKLNTNTTDKDSTAEVLPANAQPEFVDKSELLFSYMNMVAFNNKVDLKL